jgi:hypothetical protein
MFKKIVTLIDKAPVTFLPALLVEIIKRCVKDSVFNDINEAVVKVINGCTAENLKKNSPQIINNDYVAALRVISEWDATYSTSHTIERLQRFCEERLDSAKAQNCT